MKISKFLLLSIVIGGLATSCEKAYVIPKPKVVVVVPIDPNAPDVSYTAVIQPIFTANNCISCHNGTTPPNLTVSNSYASLVPAFVTAGNPATSALYNTLVNPGGNMNDNYLSSPVSDADLEKINTWITQGAKDN